MQKLDDFISQIWEANDLLRNTFVYGLYANAILPFFLIRRMNCCLSTDAYSHFNKFLKTQPDADLASVECSPPNTRSIDLYRSSPFQSDDKEAYFDTILQYVDGFEVEIQEIFDGFDFTNTLLRLKQTGTLQDVVEHFKSIDLHPATLSNDEVALLFQAITQRFAENNGDYLSEHSTPNDVTRLIVALLFAGEEEIIGSSNVISICDPAMGMGGFLHEAVDYTCSVSSNIHPLVFGQDSNRFAFAVSKATFILKGFNSEGLALGSTLSRDQNAESLFDYMLTASPFGLSWKAEEQIIKAEHRLGKEGRFEFGLPRVSDSQLLFLCHILNHMKDPSTSSGSRAVVLTNYSPLYAGGAGSGESEIRRWLCENDLLELVVALPQNIYQNTGIGTFALVLSNRKTNKRQGKVQLIDARNTFESLRRPKDRKKAFFTSAHIEALVKEYLTMEKSSKSLILDNNNFGFQEVLLELKDEHDPVKRSKSSLTEFISLEKDALKLFMEELEAEGSAFSVVPGSEKLGYRIRFNQIVAEQEMSLQLDSLAVRGRGYTKTRFGKLFKTLSRIDSHEKPLESQNSLFFPMKLSGCIKTSSEQLSVDYIQIVLREDLILNDYARIFFESREGKLCLSTIYEGNALARTTISDIKKMWVAYPPMAEQKLLIEADNKVSTLKRVITEFESEIVFNITDARNLVPQLNAVLSSLDQLSGADRILSLVRQGETKTIEFKETLSWDKKTGNKEKYLELASLKNVAAFLNTNGGVLLVGVADDGSTPGLNAEVEKYYNKNRDKFGSTGLGMEISA
jgi:type I restriction-modification system DNA methylase subunit